MGVGVHGEVGVGGLEWVRVGVGGDRVGFGGAQVRGLRSGRSEELGGWSWGRRSLGRGVELRSGRLENWGQEVGVGGVGVRAGWGQSGSGGLGLGK